jgi:hypothetical protein
LEGAGDGPGAAAGEVHVAEGAHVGVFRVGGCPFGGEGGVALLGSRTFVTCLFVLLWSGVSVFLPV